MSPRKKAKKRLLVSKAFENKEELFEGKRYFKDPKIISEHLICGICQDIFDEPWRLTCGHSFCKECLAPWLKSNNTCPIDRLTINHQYSHKDILVANIIGDYMIACPWRLFGCTLIDKYYIVKDHKDKCAHNPNKMDKVMQERALIIYNNQEHISALTSLPSPPLAPKSTMSTLDELMGQLGDAPLDSSVAESEDIALPEVELLPLSMRMYINGDDLSKRYVCSMLQSDGTAASGHASRTYKKKTKK